MTLPSEKDCLFCKIVRGEIPCCKLAEDDHCLAFLDIGPLSIGHCLVIPKYHAVKCHELPPDEMAYVGAFLPRVALALGCEDYNILQNNGKLAHQEVTHVHFHIIPKTSENDGLQIGWNALTKDKPSMDDLVAMAKTVGARFK